MRQFFKVGFLTAALAVILSFNSQTVSAADTSQNLSYPQINLSNPKDSTPLIVSIKRSQSIAYGWRPWQKIRVWGYVQHAGGGRSLLKDKNGKSSWNIRLNSLGQCRLTLFPAAQSFSGRVVIQGNGKTLSAPGLSQAESAGCTLEKVYEYRFPDGVLIKVHFTDQILEENGQEEYFPREVLDAAVSAYQTITQFEGFNTEGYAFASPDKSYAYDPDKTIDIYLGSPNQNQDFSYHGFNRLAFKDAPCFDTIRASKTEFHATILLPANYGEFIKNWEHINPSPLGPRNVEVDLRGTLIHEMLHVILFYYNRNLNKELDLISPAPAKKPDWYVEGLARYFETFAGARHDFYSQGFKQVLPDKIRFSRGGSNYFMCYPDQSFMDLRYENALFWRFIDTRYGMRSIEHLSREFRSHGHEDFKQALEKVTGCPFDELLKEFAVAILFKDFGLKDDSAFLKEVARTHLVYRDQKLYLKDGYGSERGLGAVCETDWIGTWGDRLARHGDPAVAGDNSNESDVSGWATDFYQIDIAENTTSLPVISVLSEPLNAALKTQIILVTRGGSILRPRTEGPFSPEQEIRKQGLQARDIERIYLLVTHTDSQNTLSYKVQTSQFA